MGRGASWWYDDGGGGWTANYTGRGDGFRMYEEDTAHVQGDGSLTVFVGCESGQDTIAAMLMDVRGATC